MSDDRVKLIFLDCDGVMNSSWSFKNIGRSWPPRDFLVGKESPNFHPRALEIIKKLVVEDGFKIVISSTWRQSYNDMSAFDTLLELPPGSVIGRTPSSQTGFRGHEIDAWLTAEKLQHGSATLHGIKNPIFVIIDDDSDMTDKHKEHHFVQTRFITRKKKGEPLEEDGEGTREVTVSERGYDYYELETDGLNWDHYKKIHELVEKQRANS